MEGNTKKCPFCGEEILGAAVKCKHCGSMLEASKGAGTATAGAKDYGMFLIGIPVVAVMMIWFWIGNMNMLQSPGSKLNMLTILTVAGTAVLACLEARSLGMVTDRTKGSYSPIAWFFIIVLLWVVGYPAYLYKRRHYGLKNMLVPGLIVMAVFIVSAMGIGAAINERINEINSYLNP